MNELEINCKGIKNLSVNMDETVDIILQDINMDFLEDVSAKDIVLYKDNKELLEQMDSDEIIDYLEEKFGIENLAETQRSTR